MFWGKYPDMYISFYNEMEPSRLRLKMNNTFPLEIMLSAIFKIAYDNRRYLTRLVELINENYPHDLDKKQDIDFVVESIEEAEMFVPLQELESESDNSLRTMMMMLNDDDA